MEHIYNGLLCILVLIVLFLISNIIIVFFLLELLQKMRLFVKAKQVTKHCIENEGIPLSYDSSEFDGSIIFALPTPTIVKRSPSIVSSTSKNQPTVLKEFMCSIWLVQC